MSEPTRPAAGRRTLVVDNHDSFTWNLVHLLAGVTGREPVVVANDDPSWDPALARGFDAVVLSPGPGRPQRASDVGHCRAVLAQPEVPVLGVCLGHQAIAYAHGATVALAPEPRHGRLSRVSSPGTGLFAGVPDGFTVTRYHSLAVTDLPPELEPLAWSEDGVLMALQHVSLPRWGVQFHPESVCSEHGALLLENVLQLVPPLPAPRVELRAPADTPARVRRLRVHARRVDVACSAEVVFDALFRGEPGAFWLDSRDPDLPDGPPGRAAVVGAPSGPLGRVATVDVHAGTVTVDGRVLAQPDPLAWLEADLAGLDVELPALPSDFALGWVGYLGYGLGSDALRSRHRPALPDAVLVFADRAVVLEGRTPWLLALSDDQTVDEAEEWLQATESVVRGLAGRAVPEPRRPVVRGPGGRPARHALRHGRAAYVALVERCQQEIRAGETYEACLTNELVSDAQLDPWEGYRWLRRSNPSPAGAYLTAGGVAVLSASPERFLRIDRTGRVESRPVKGTRPRGADPEADAALARGLATAEKDRAENLMVVDLVRHDLGRTAGLGSVRADDLFRVETWPMAHQLVSTVTAQLRDGVHPVACVRAAFPGGSMTGAPKERTMALLDELEQGPRGVYAGAVGSFSLSGAVDLSIVIRTVVVAGGTTTYGVGGAVVALSDPAAEWEETLVKLRPALDLLGATLDDVEGTRPG
ncbi:para-aminobenzoate synthetase [Motilibacter rhizosphaerae]|uniref:aminodeoxychorismate synthase n=1 Tax=Motilibacter rhizosphaerae TaxID=598652 RepID=A0A4Q7NX09_9ACTN|nr:aminodeoxychorismate synthase component I [Motilibacter rhizosphaerae]RZS91737.1 para-aminobenzoate synthetase [Motilibacter rhizosphaerae]